MRFYLETPRSISIYLCKSGGGGGGGGGGCVCGLWVCVCESFASSINRSVIERSTTNKIISTNNNIRFP